MHYIDGVFAIVLCIFIFFGFKAGILRRGVALLFLVVGLVLATRSMHGLGTFLIKIWNVHEVVGAVLAFVIVFFWTVISAIIVVAILARHSNPPHFLSRILGAVFGVFEGSIYLSLLLIVLNLYSLPRQEARDNSILYRPLRGFAPLVFDQTNAALSGSTSFSDELKKSFEKFKFLPPD